MHLAMFCRSLPRHHWSKLPKYACDNLRQCLENGFGCDVEDILE